MHRLLVLFFLSAIWPDTSLNAQNPEHKEIPYYQEEPDDPYIPTDRSTQAKTPAYRFQQSNIFTVQVNVDENDQNILGDAANEPSIAVDPVNPGRMAIGWRQFDNIASNFRQAGYAYTEDEGNNWTFPDVIEPGIFRSDPVLDFNKEGVFYYNSLTSSNGDFSCDVFSSSASGDWGNKVYAYGGDKQWMVVDRSETSGAGNIYAHWKSYYSACTPGDFTRSVDGGDSYEACVLIPSTLVRGSMSVASDGTLYAFGETNTGFKVAISDNAYLAEETPSWQIANVNLGGEMYYYDGPNPGGMLGQAWVATDHSFTETHGNVYALSSVAPFGNNDPLELMFSRSVDGGTTWEAPIRINDDGYSNWQWFGTLSVAPNGRIDVTWLDTRDNPGTVISALYYSYSTDGGLSFSPNEKLSDVFDPHLGWPNQEKIGDYMHSISTNKGVHLAWSATFNGEQDIYYSFITPPTVMSNESTADLENLAFIAYPNPSSSTFYMQYQLQFAGRTGLQIISPSGKILYTLSDEYQTPGYYNIKVDRDLPAGMYYCSLQQDGKTIGIKKLVIY